MRSRIACSLTSILLVGGAPFTLAGRAARAPIAVFDEFCKFFEDRYAFFELRGVDWEGQKDVFRPKVNATTSDDELFSLLRQMIDPLDDHHTSIKRGQSTYFADDWLP